MLKLDWLREHINYDPETGNFTRIRTNKGNVCNKPIGCVYPNGYVYVRLLGKQYLAHRLAWFYVKGVWPVKLIDHKDTIRSNNAWSNLREADENQNAHNKGMSSHNTSGIKGVSWYAAKNKWQAYVGEEGKQTYLGLYESREAAEAAVISYRESAHKDFANHG